MTSGMSQGTVVIEASATSGAKMQARLRDRARQAGLPPAQPRHRARVGAASTCNGRGCTRCSDVADIVRLLRPAAEQRNRAMERVQIPLTLF